MYFSGRELYHFRILICSVNDTYLKKKKQFHYCKTPTTHIKYCTFKIFFTEDENMYSKRICELLELFYTNTMK